MISTIAMRRRAGKPAIIAIGFCCGADCAVSGEPVLSPRLSHSAALFGALAVVYVSRTGSSRSLRCCL